MYGLCTEYGDGVHPIAVTDSTDADEKAKAA